MLVFLRAVLKALSESEQGPGGTTHLFSFKLNLLSLTALCQQRNFMKQFIDVFITA